MNLPPPPLLTFLARALRVKDIWLPGPSDAWESDWRRALPGRLWLRPLPEEGWPWPNAALIVLAAEAAGSGGPPMPPATLLATGRPGPTPAGPPAAATATGSRLFLIGAGDDDSPTPPGAPARGSESSTTAILASLRLPGSGPLWLAGSERADLRAASRDALAALAEQDRGSASLDLLSAEAGELVLVLAAARGSLRALELGAGAGASTVWLAQALAATGGALTAIEKDTARANLARRALRAAGLADRVDLRIGEVERLAPKLERGFDLLLMDEGLEDRTERLELLLKLGLLRSGALILAHGGRQDPARDAAFQALMQLDRRIAARLRLNLGAGMTMAVVA